MASRLRHYLADPFLRQLYQAVRAAGPLRGISVDLTRSCNIRCTGCYYFAEGMDQVGETGDVDVFVRRERERGTNFVTVVGGEPSLELDRLKTLYDAFRLSVATNGLRRIPVRGFEDLPIGVSVWGDHATDRRLRGGDRTDVFARALERYRNDPRAFFYYTVAPGHAGQIEEVVETCIANGNRVLFNFYSDLTGQGGALDSRRGFAPVREVIDEVIRRHPRWILMTSSFARVVSTGRQLGEEWGYATCTSVSADHPGNAGRIANGNPYNPHFRAYNADLATTRRCCTGVSRDCDSCLDTWEHFSWVTLNLRKHLVSKQEFTHWLATTWLFYFINRLVDVDEGARLLPELHRRTCTASMAASGA